MKTLTPQQVFDNALFGIRGQGYKQSKRFIGGSETCAYRGKNDTKCGIGHSLPDDLAEQADSLGESDISTVISEIDEVSDLFVNCDAELLEMLQRAHDNATSAERFEREMANIARVYNLHYTPVPA